MTPFLFLLPIANPVVAGHARFTVISPELVRTEYSESGKFVDEPSLFAIHRDASFSDFTVHKQQDGSWVIETSRFTLTYRADGQPFSPANLTATVRFSNGRTAQWHFGDKNTANLHGTRNSLDYVNPDSDTIPDGLLARDGWYWLDDSSRPLLDSRGWIEPRPMASPSPAPQMQIDGYFFAYGDDYRAALRALTRVSGDVPLPRRQVMGTWYSRWWAYTSDDYRQIVREFHDHQFPLDMLVMDMDWHKDGWTGLSWNRDLLPDAEKLVSELHAQRIGITLNDHPDGGVGPQEDEYARFMKDMGSDPAKGDTLQYDAGDEKYISTLFRDTHEPLEQEGVDFWWVDWSGDDKRPFNLLSWINELYFRHSEEAGLRGQSFARWADWGDQRHPIHFSGDTWATWDMLAYEIPFTATAGNVGAFYWSHDIGGFIGLRNGELTARWTQFGATSAAIRLHSVKTFWMDKRPWTYDQDVEDSMRASFHLRAELMPYVYSSAWESHRDSIPLDRPLYLDAPDDERSYQNPQEYYFGDAFLAAPITTSGIGDSHVASQDVFFPGDPGRVRWFNWFTGEEFAAGTQTRAAADLDSFPLFARGGAPIVMQPYVERPATEPLRTLVVRVFPGVDGVPGRATLYEDDGLTQGYLHGQYRETEIQYAKSASDASVSVAPARGTYPSAPARRQIVVEFAQVDAPKAVAIDGAPALEARYDATRRLETITVPARDAGAGTQVRISF